ncbi:MAG: hypothetical protein ACXVPQ_05260 [Bacteroidia bacterium]
MKNYFRWIILFSIFLYRCDDNRGTIDTNGKNVVQHLKLRCTEPQKRYAENVDVAVKGSIDAVKDVENASVEAALKTQVEKLTDYSQQGLDLDLILFRICEMSINRNFRSGQTDSLIKEVTDTWNHRLSINEQKNIISQLNVELSSNLKTANELKKNVETILSTISDVAGDQILRNAKIKIFSVFFPKENLNLNGKSSAQELATNGIDAYLRQKLDTNRLEQQKFTAAGKVIAMTVDQTLETLNSLADKDHNRYEFSNEIWKTNSTNLSRIDIFDVTKFQSTYSELNSLRSNYDIVVNRSIDYLKDLRSFFRPDKNVINKEGIEKILTSERFAFDLINTYSKSLKENIQNITELKEVVAGSLK